MTLKYELKNANPILLQAIGSNKTIYLWGAASSGHRALFRLVNLGANVENIRFIDKNFSKLQSIQGRRILSPDELVDIDLSNSIIFITSTISTEIINSLDKRLKPITHYLHNLIFERDIYFRYSKEFLELMTEIDDKLNLDQAEAYSIWSTILNLDSVEGDLVEVGVYKGASLKLIHRAAKNAKKNTRLIHGFDTFSGIPSNTGFGDEKFTGYLSDNSFDEVKKYLPSEILLYQGIFPASARKVEFNRVAFLHLDVDTYTTTLDALKFFWEKLPIFGIVIVHDYNSQGCPGVKQAVDEFQKLNSIPLIEINESQVMLMKSSL